MSKPKRRAAAVTQKFYTTNVLEYKALHWWTQCPLCRWHDRFDLIGNAAQALADHIQSTHQGQTAIYHEAKLNL